MVEDGAETQDLAAEHPEVVERLLDLAERGRLEIGDLDRPGRGDRPAGWVFQTQVPTAPAKP